MAIRIKDAETDRLARRLAALTGERITDAVRTALRERIEREERARGRPQRKASVEEVLAIARQIAEAPCLDDRSDDEILGYDDRGLPR